MKITIVDYKLLKMDIFQFFLLVTKFVRKLVFFSDVFENYDIKLAG